MRSLPHGWRLSRHAEEQMLERGVAPSELVTCLAHPDRRTPDPKGKAGYAYWWHGSIGALVSEPDKMVVTILINGASKEDWQEHSRNEARRSHRADAEALMALLRPETPKHDRKPAQRRTARPASEPAESRNVLDRTTDKLYKEALKHAGGDPRRIRVRGPGKIEILPEAS